MLKYKYIFAAIAIASAMLSGCTSASQSTPTETTSETTAAAPVILAELKGGKCTIPELDFEQKAVPQNDGTAFVKAMKIGWNLGNTFDATDDDGAQVADDMTLETAWVGVQTSKAIIDNIKHAGFNTIRVPVSWHDHLDENGSIKTAYLDRVQEVVNYVIDNDMYCIINIHHDIGDDFYYPDEENFDTSAAYVKSIWTQLAERFGEYDNMLVFESINEPRLKGSNLEWNFNDSNVECQKSAECINKLNQTFVDTVRASGGNNAERFLLVPGYAAAYKGVLTDYFKLPTDTIENHIIVSVHAYIPYSFALQTSGGMINFDLNDASCTSEIATFMDGLYDKFVSKGTPVLIGEFAAVNKKENTQSRTDWAAYYVAYARSNGITCLWWDNNAFFGAGENMGLFNRKEKTWRYDDVILAMMKYC